MWKRVAEACYLGSAHRQSPQTATHPPGERHRNQTHVVVLRGLSELEVVVGASVVVEELLWSLDEISIASQVGGT